MSSPALAVVGVLTLVPIAFSVYISLNTATSGPDGFSFTWAGLANYRNVFHSRVFGAALVFTVLYAVVTVLIEMALGMLVALAVDRMTAGRSLALACLLVPWAIITVISAQLWSYIFNGVYGIANALLVWSHLVSHPTSFLSTPSLAIGALAVADMWKTTPFVAIVLLGGLQMIDGDLYDAASLDGAGRTRAFLAITLPLLKPSCVTALTFRVLQSFGLFDLPYILTHGGPGHSTESIGVLAYDVLFGDLDFGAGAALATVVTLMVLVAAIVFLRVFRFGDEVVDR